jgi:hypothetical protein
MVCLRSLRELVTPYTLITTPEERDRGPFPTPTAEEERFRGLPDRSGAEQLHASPRSKVRKDQAEGFGRTIERGFALGSISPERKGARRLRPAGHRSGSPPARRGPRSEIRTKVVVEIGTLAIRDFGLWTAGLWIQARDRTRSEFWNSPSPRPSPRGLGEGETPGRDTKIKCLKTRTRPLTPALSPRSGARGERVGRDTKLKWDRRGNEDVVYHHVTKDTKRCNLVLLVPLW